MFPINLVHPIHTPAQPRRAKRWPGNRTLRNATTLRIALVWALLLISIPSSFILSEPVQAQDPLPDEEIVYIDAAGIIRVWDPYLAGSGQVQWVSPIGGYTALALGDVNNDGDEEIIAVGGSGAAGFLTIYDPVLNSTSLTEDGEFNGIPWKKLYELPLGATPIFVGAGELDAGLAGDEIVYGYELGATSTIVVLNDTDTIADGTGWKVHITASFDFTWDKLTVGNLDTEPGLSTDEIILTDSGDGKDIKSKLHVYRVNTGDLANKTPLFFNENTGNRWRGSAVGQVYAGGRQELVAYRSTANSASSSTFFFKYRPEDAADPKASFSESDGDALVIFPRPEDIFLGNINGTVNGEVDDEIFFLRKMSDSIANAVRFFARNRGADSISESNIERTLDTDNRWVEGVAGNVDGDVNGRDELIIMRNDRIRMFRHESNGTLSQPIPDLLTSTNSNSLAVGDLDMNGFFSGVEISTAVTGNDVGIRTGGVGSVNVNVTSSGDPVAFTASIVGGRPDWVNDFRSTGSATPATVVLGVDAANLLPGAYSLSILIESTGVDVTNPRLTVPVTFEVLPATVTLSPGSVGYVNFPCVDGAENSSVQIRVTASTILNYAAAVVSQPEFEAIGGGLQGNAVSGSVSAAGVMELKDSYGNIAQLQTLAAAAPEIGATGVITWHNGTTDPTWVQVTSEEGQINPSATSVTPTDLITVTIRPGQLPAGTTNAAASLILVTDERTGDAPDNIRFVPINYLCADSQVSLPVMFGVRAVAAR